MNRNEFVKHALNFAMESGCTAAETFYAYNNAFEAGALQGEIDRYSVSRTAGVSVRVQKNGCDGYAYTECLDDPEALVAHAMDNAACLTVGDEHPMQTKQRYQKLVFAAPPLVKLPESEKIDLALTLERLTLAADPRVERVVCCNVETREGGIEMQNTQGLLATREKMSAYCYVEPVVRQGDEVQTGFAFRMGMDAADIEGCARDAVADAVTRLGGAPVPSGSYRVLLKNTVMADLLSAFSRMFSAAETQRGCSLLQGLEGQTIANQRITLTDDPFDPIAPRAFDGEGTPCIMKHVIKNGVLLTLLHNLKTAKKAGVASTGNAVRASAASAVDVGPTVLRLQAGTDDPHTLLCSMSDGLLITDLQGLHAGVDAVSGDFSLKAAGRLIEQGKDVRAVSQITIAGNFLTLLQNVSALGNDGTFTMPSSAYVNCPSVLIDSLQIAGASPNKKP
ncbi:MAG: TldD/PmbA family protein [Clostridia bacterium]